MYQNTNDHETKNTLEKGVSNLYTHYSNIGTQYYYGQIRSNVDIELQIKSISISKLPTTDEPPNQHQQTPQNSKEPKRNPQRNHNEFFGELIENKKQSPI